MQVKNKQRMIHFVDTDDLCQINGASINNSPECMRNETFKEPLL
jgi:hypothetical protein